MCWEKYPNQKKPHSHRPQPPTSPTPTFSSTLRAAGRSPRAPPATRTARRRPLAPRAAGPSPRAPSARLTARSRPSPRVLPARRWLLPPLAPAILFLFLLPPCSSVFIARESRHADAAPSHSPCALLTFIQIGSWVSTGQRSRRSRDGRARLDLLWSS
jgi:hypothetical protein